MWIGFIFSIENPSVKISSTERRESAVVRAEGMADLRRHLLFLLALAMEERR